MGILSRLVTKQVNILLLSVFVIYSILECTCISNELLQIWKYPKLWVGFLKCVQLTKPQSFGILLQVLSSLFTPFIMNLITFFFFFLNLWHSCNLYSASSNITNQFSLSQFIIAPLHTISILYDEWITQARTKISVISIIQEDSSSG